MGAITVFGLMSCSGIIDIDMRGYRKACIKDVVFLIMKEFMLFNENIAQLPCGNLKPHIMQCFQQYGLCDMAVIMLVKDKSFEFQIEMPAVQIFWEFSGE